MKYRVRSYLYPHRLALLFALAQVFLLSGLELLKPWPLKVIIDNVLSGDPLPWESARALAPQAVLGLACGALILIYLVVAALRILNDYTTIRIGQEMVNELRRDLYSHIQRLSLSFYTRRQLGDLLYRIAADTLALQTLTMNGLFPVLSALLFVSGMFAILLWLDGYLALVALAVCPALAGTIALLNRKMSAAALHARSKESAVYSVVQRTLAGIRVVQAFTKEQEEQQRFMQASEESLRADLRLYTLQNLYSGAVSVTIAAGTAGVVWIAAHHVLSGELTIGEMVVFTSYLASLYAPLSHLFESYGLVQRARAGVRRAFEILESEPPLAEGRRCFPATGARGEIAFESVTFGYDPARPVLKEIDLRVRPGEKIAIVGPTGAGKSTLVSLLPRFYDPQAGRITIDGVDVREFRLQSLRRQIAMVLQPPIVFPLTVRENIAYGRPEASLEEVVAAARAAHVHEFVSRLPQEYDTPVGEQGADLSEGQKLRLTIARALLIGAPILILDEPTSSIDPETESLLMASLERLMAGRTTVIIAHRLSTVREADRIVVLHEGRIVECGAFRELVRAGGAFASLYRKQFLGARRRHAPIGAQDGAVEGVG
jgi:ATP-binding cassette subfamily B protein